MIRIRDKASLFTLDDAARFFNMREDTLWSAIKEGRISCIGTGKRGVRFTVDNLLEFIDGRRVE